MPTERPWKTTDIATVLNEAFLEGISAIYLLKSNTFMIASPSGTDLGPI